MRMAKLFKKWLLRLREGDQSAFLPLYEQTAPGLMRFLLWKTNGDKALAEDVLQEAYVKFLLHLDNIQAEEDVALRAYLLRITKHCLIDKVARSPHSNKKYIPLEDFQETPNFADSTPQERAVEVRELAVAMKSLNEKDSEIIWLRDGLGFSHKEVADEIGISEEASRQAYVRAKKNLLSGIEKLTQPLLEVGHA
jgi:RNA polymerase sigma-70 factor (ECF subfamily)